jgi:hypothetical protein
MNESRLLRKEEDRRDKSIFIGFWMVLIKQLFLLSGDGGKVIEQHRKTKWKSLSSRRNDE